MALNDTIPKGQIKVSQKKGEKERLIEKNTSREVKKLAMKIRSKIKKSAGKIKLKI